MNETEENFDESNNIISEWKKNLLDRKPLIKYIDEIKNSFRLFSKDNEVNFNEIQVNIPSPAHVTVDIIEENVNELNLAQIFQLPNGIMLNKFITMLDKEIRKIYLFYNNIERDLYIQINSRLHFRKNYDNLYLDQIFNELQELLKISKLTISITEYISQNMIMIKKVLEYLDLKIDNYFGAISEKFLRERLEMTNSDLNYILQFKTIDEVSALLDFLLQDLKGLYSNIDKYCRKNRSRRDLTDDSLNFINRNSLELVAELDTLVAELERQIVQIDESNFNFRNNIENWTFYIKNGTQRVNNYVPNVSRMARNSIINKKEDGFLEFFLNKRSSTKNSSSIGDYFELKADMSIENRRNLALSLVHIALYMMNISIILPSFFIYVEKITNNKENGVISGCILGLNPLMSFLSEKYFFKILKSYKKLLIVSISIIIVGNLFYVFADFFDSIIFLIFSQIFMGLGNFRVMNRKYLIQYSPNFLYNYYSYNYICYNWVGLILGSLLAFVCTFIDFSLDDSLKCNEITNPGWMSIFIFLIFIVVVVILFTDPKSEFFQDNLNFYDYSGDNNKVDETSNVNNNGNSPKSPNSPKKKETISVDLIDEKLNEINERNQYSDTNLVTKFVSILINREKSFFQYSLKCFILLNCLILASKILFDYGIITLIFFLRHKFDISARYISIIMATNFALIMSSILLYKYYRLRTVKEKHYLVIILFLSIVVYGIYVVYEIHFLLCSLLFSISVIFSNLIENLSFSLLSKIIPSDFEFKRTYLREMFIILFVLGKILGMCLATIADQIANEDNILLLSNCFCGAILLGLFVISLIYYKQIRIKAISRIIRKATVSNKANKK